MATAAINRLNFDRVICVQPPTLLLSLPPLLCLPVFAFPPLSPFPAFDRGNCLQPPTANPPPVVVSPPFPAVEARIELAGAGVTYGIFMTDVVLADGEEHGPRVVGVFTLPFNLES